MNTHWVMTESGWRHRPWWKVAINSVLRAIQVGCDQKWLIATVADGKYGPDLKPVTVGYRFCRIYMGAHNAP